MNKEAMRSAKSIINQIKCHKYFYRALKFVKKDKKTSSTSAKPSRITKPGNLLARISI